MIKKYYCIVVILLFYAINTAYSQHNKITVFGKNIDKSNIDTNGYIRCATTEYEASLKTKDPQRLSSEAFEKWINTEIKQLERRKKESRTAAVVISIPVVIHVIHNGDAYGIGENITDEQVQSQIEILNQDFRKIINTPGFNTHPVGADIEIEFCLAGTDPYGYTTNGINRINLNIESFGERQIETILKPKTQWNPEQYFNIWTCRFGKGNGGNDNLERTLGYAQFPSASNLPGLAPNSGNAATDGIIIAYYAFGSSDIYPQGNYIKPYDKGRTTTHETGHWFGLRHIWGDSPNCHIDDYCADTPAASQANTICIKHGSCTPRDMIENYMDYTPDSCMNIFTQDQKTRMQTVLLNSPRRKNLVTSPKCEISDIAAPDKPEKIQLYPNPVSELLNIAVPESLGTDYSYIIYNTLGQVIVKDQGIKNSNLQLNVSQYSAGIYFMVIKTNHQTKTLRFIKK